MGKIIDNIMGFLCLGMSLMFSTNIFILNDFDDVRAIAVCVFILLANLYFNKERR